MKLVVEEEHSTSHWTKFSIEEAIANPCGHCFTLSLKICILLLISFIFLISGKGAHVVIIIKLLEKNEITNLT